MIISDYFSYIVAVYKGPWRILRIPLNFSESLFFFPFRYFKNLFFSSCLKTSFECEGDWGSGTVLCICSSMHNIVVNSDVLGFIELIVCLVKRETSVHKMFKCQVEGNI